VGLGITLASFKVAVMVYFTCDVCGCPIDGDRFVVRMEVIPTFDPDEVTEAMLDVDHLHAIAEQLSSSSNHSTPAPRKTFRYDVCENCLTRIERDPLGRLKRPRVRFSEN
jgi:hypothetical protein